MWHNIGVHNGVVPCAHRHAETCLQELKVGMPSWFLICLRIDMPVGSGLTTGWLDATNSYFSSDSKGRIDRRHTRCLFSSSLWHPHIVWVTTRPPCEGDAPWSLIAIVSWSHIFTNIVSWKNACRVWPLQAVNGWVPHIMNFIKMHMKRGACRKGMQLFKMLRVCVSKLIIELSGRRWLVSQPVVAPLPIEMLHGFQIVRIWSCSTEIVIRRQDHIRQKPRRCHLEVAWHVGHSLRIPADT